MRSCTNPVPRRLGKKCGNDSKKIGRNEKGSCAMTLCPGKIIVLVIVDLD